MGKCINCGKKLTYEGWSDDNYADCKVCGAEMRIPATTCLCSNCGFYTVPDSRVLVCPKCGQQYDLPRMMGTAGVRESH